MDIVRSLSIAPVYPNYKRKFKEICTEEFANKYLLQIKKMHKWILNQIKD